VRSFLEGQGTKFGADWLGKLKMWLQSAALVAIFVAEEAARSWPAGSWFFDPARLVLVYAMVIVTALSGLQYLWRAALLLR
jgi:CDP-diacylglycerol--glycerol-3-phosphate 3-phosphatidyltransferase